MINITTHYIIYFKLSDEAIFCTNLHSTISLHQLNIATIYQSKRKVMEYQNNSYSPLNVFLDLQFLVLLSLNVAFYI